MAKRKQLINLKTRDIEFVLNNIYYRLESFNPNTMTLTVLRLEAEEKTTIKDFPFAHLPKKIKKLIKQN